MKESLLTRGAWIETQGNLVQQKVVTSLLTRGAWIETFSTAETLNKKAVAPHTGSVD